MPAAGLGWRSPLPEMTLSPNQVHVWQVSLDQWSTCLPQLVQVLSEDERVRAAHLHLARDRRRFIVGRWGLRTILGRYLKVGPCQVQFAYGVYGKPYLAPGCGQPALRFNLAHSHELALYALAWDREVGIDVEHVHFVPDAEQIAARFFSARENAAFRLLPEEQRQEGFFRYWTCKEAYIKAVGNGLSHPLDRFDVSWDGKDGPVRLHVNGDPVESGRWSLRVFEPAPGYVAALAVEGHDWHPVCWRYE